MNACNVFFLDIIAGYNFVLFSVDSAIGLFYEGLFATLKLRF